MIGTGARVLGCLWGRKHNRAGRERLYIRAATPGQQHQGSNTRGPPPLTHACMQITHNVCGGGMQIPQHHTCISHLFTGLPRRCGSRKRTRSCGMSALYPSASKVKLPCDMHIIREGQGRALSQIIPG